MPLMLIPPFRSRIASSTPSYVVTRGKFPEIRLLQELWFQSQLSSEKQISRHFKSNSLILYVTELQNVIKHRRIFGIEPA